MESLKELYRIGRGRPAPTIAPTKAAELFAEENLQPPDLRLLSTVPSSKTGRGHMTDTAILDVLGHEKCEIVFSDKPDEELPHPNTMVFEAFAVDGGAMALMEVYSVGGGRIVIKGRPAEKARDVYKLSTLRNQSIL